MRFQRLWCSVLVFFGAVNLPQLDGLITGMKGDSSNTGVVPFIEGTYHKCPPEKEGQEMDITQISKHTDIGCFTCKCQRGQVVCHRTLCEVPKNCFFLQERLNEKSCCLTCRDCVLNGTTHASLSRWSDPTDPCVQFSCQAGIVTKYRELCHTPCENPISPRPGQCCPSCQGCSLGGREFTEGTNFTSPSDRCLTCSCQNGTISCAREACPVLPCPLGKQVFSPRMCCPVCKGVKIVNSRKECVIGVEAFDDGGSFPLDQCTSCSCIKGTSLCHRTVCPKLQCPTEHQIATPGTCCLQCRSAHQEKKAECYFQKTTYANGTTWQKDCSTCSCFEGQVECQEIQCDRPKCPPGQKGVTAANDCCPKCVETDGVCAAFGDPHYRTFDGLFYRFQGRCRYTLLTDECQKSSASRNSSRSFSIQVFNDPRGPSSRSARTRALLIKIDDMPKIRLGQMMKVKILSKRVTLPHLFVGHVAIYPEGHNVIVKFMKKGILLVWNGDSYVEVRAAPKLKGSLCGLCGNYNDNLDDEYTTKQGFIETDVYKFGNSWKVGHSLDCHSSTNKTGCTTKQKRKRNFAVCNQLKGDLFKPCHKYVNPTPYMKSCLADMCTCEENGRCFCDELHAYVRHCSRFGIDIKDWLEQTGCGSHWCPTGASWTPCGGVCRRTCKNHKTAFCNKKCVAGCECQNGAVWLNNRCVHPRHCPSS